MLKVLTIAGSDSSGGAGIQADIKTMTAHGIYAMSALTALTAQNTQGVTAILDVSPDFLTAQLKAVFDDIPPDAVKVGMVSSRELIETIAENLAEHNAKNIVVDPVMVATSGAKLLKDDAILTLKEKLFPLAAIITPNIFEAEILGKRKISTKAQMEQTAQELAERYGCAVLIKGGHRSQDADDCLLTENKIHWLHQERINNPNTHGTGCTLSSAIACNLAKGMPTMQAVAKAKQYVSAALKAMLNLGKGSGPLNHILSVKCFSVVLAKK